MDDATPEGRLRILVFESARDHSSTVEGDERAFQTLFGGLLLSLPVADHPVGTMSWERARDNLLEAAENGLGANLHWITTDGRETTTPEAIYEDLFAVAMRGLQRVGFAETEIEATLEPLRNRVRLGLTPAEWKRQQVADRLERGRGFTQAVYDMQREYVEMQRETVFEGHFVDWLD